MERKLIKQGGGGYTIYLPKKWVDDKGLSSGGTVNVVEKDTALIIRSESKTLHESTIDMQSKNGFELRVLLTHAYRRGIQKVKLNNINENLQKDAKEIVSKLLLGFEITSKTNNSITIENISEPTNQKFEIILDRLLLITDETFSFILEQNSKRQYGNMDEMKDIRANHDRFLLFCRRLISKEQIDANPVILWELLTFLQHIEHTAYYMYEYLVDNKIKPSDRIIISINEIRKYFEMLSSAYKERDLSIVHLINDKRKIYHFGKALKDIEFAKGKEAVVLSYTRELFRLIQISTSPIISLCLEKESN